MLGLLASSLAYIYISPVSSRFLTDFLKLYIVEDEQRKREGMSEILSPLGASSGNGRRYVQNYNIKNGTFTTQMYTEY